MAKAPKSRAGTQAPPSTPPMERIDNTTYIPPQLPPFIPFAAAGRGKGIHYGKSRKSRHCVVNPMGCALTKPAVRRLARRGGCKRIAGNIQHECQLMLRKFLEDVLSKVAALVNFRRNGAPGGTVTALDVIYALKKAGITYYHNDLPNRNYSPSWAQGRAPSIK